MNPEYIADIIYSVLQGEDYRKYVMATINERFINEVVEILKVAAEYKMRYDDQWLDRLIAKYSKARGKDAKRKLTWIVGLNEKTVHNMTGTTKKKVIAELGKANVEGIKLLVNKLLNDELTPKLIIKYKGDDIKFSGDEALLLFNTIATTKLTIQGGAWSEVGKQVEKALLYVLFNLLGVPPQNYILDQEKINKKKAKEIGTSRDIDGIIVNRENKYLTIEVKLLGIGNPEMIDEPLARDSDLFITDQATSMMKKELEKKGITTIVLREDKFKGTMKKLARFFDENKIPYSADPESVAKVKDDRLKDKIVHYVKDFLQGR